MDMSVFDILGKLERPSPQDANLWPRLAILRQQVMKTWRPMRHDAEDTCWQDAVEDNMFHRQLTAWRHLDHEEEAMLRTGNVRGLVAGQAWGWSPAGQAVEYRLYGVEVPIVFYAVIDNMAVLRDMHKSHAHRSSIDVCALIDLAIAFADRDVLASYVIPPVVEIWDYVDASRPAVNWSDDQRALLVEAQDWVKSGRAREAAFAALREIADDQGVTAVQV